MRREEGLGGKIWRGGLLGELFSGLFVNFFDRVEEYIHEQQKRMLARLSKVIVGAVGALFLLNALALFISDYLMKAAWAGYGIVGGVLVLLVLIFWKESHPFNKS